MFYTSSTYDTHLYDIEFETETVQDYRYFVNEVLTQPVPLGALVPKGGRNILAAGLGMDIDHDALASVRLRRNVMRSGVAAAVSAETAIDEGCGVFSCYEKIKEKLIEKRIFKPLPVLSELAVNIRKNVAEDFSSPSKAVRSCSIYYASKMLSAERLSELLKDGKTAVCAAKALALKGDDKGADYFKDEKTAAATYLLGKVNKDGKYTDLLIERLGGSLMPAAFSALVRNAASGDKKAEKAVRSLAENKSFSYRLTLNGNGNKTVLERSEAFRKIFETLLGGIAAYD